MLGAGACDSVPAGDAGADRERAATPPTGTTVDWLQGDVEQRFALVSKHLRGFDAAMVEVGYRYGELSWASRDRNWRFAAYQLDKLVLALDNGIERRPARGASACMMDSPVDDLRAAIEHRDAAATDAAIERLTATCNACHVAEGVGFITVQPPRVRYSPVIHGPAADAGASPNNAARELGTRGREP